MASKSYRTMVLAMRSFTPKMRAAFKRFQNDKTKGNNIDLAKKLQQSFECDLTFLGITAVEDTLQLDAPQTIERLSHSGIKVWICTGDKYETTLGIAKACQLVPIDQRNNVIIIEENKA